MTIISNLGGCSGSDVQTVMDNFQEWRFDILSFSAGGMSTNPNRQRVVAWGDIGLRKDPEGRTDLFDFYEPNTEANGTLIQFNQKCLVTSTLHFGDGANEAWAIMTNREIDSGGSVLKSVDGTGTGDQLLGVGGGGPNIGNILANNLISAPTATDAQSSFVGGYNSQASSVDSVTFYRIVEAGTIMWIHTQSNAAAHSAGYSRYDLNQSHYEWIINAVEVAA